MQPYIGRWHCRYRLSGHQPDAAVAAGRLERAVRSRSLDTYADALDQVFDHGSTVYVVRHVRQRVTLSASMQQNELTLARTWGERTCAAVVRTIAAHGDDASHVARFADTADYVAHFLADLVHGEAWQRWYYGAFSKHRRSTPRDAVVAILDEYATEMAAILRYLAQLGCLDDVLALLDGDTTRWLWRARDGLHTGDRSSHDHLIFVRSAFELIDALGLWAGAQPSEEVFCTEYLATLPLEPEWTSRRSLAMAIVSVMRFAATRGYVAGARTRALATWEQRREELLAVLDWTDSEWLGSVTEDWLRTTEATGADATLAHLPERLPSLTPSHRLILDAIRRLFESRAVVLDARSTDVERDAMRLYAALAKHDAALAAHPACRAIVLAVVTSYQVLARASRPGDVIEAIATRSTDAFAAGLTKSERDGLRTAAEFGRAAADVLVAAARSSGSTRVLTDAVSIESACAGLFLLVRAIVDARLPQILANIPDAPPLQGVLLSLGLLWSGEKALRLGTLDSGLVLWSGASGESDPLSSLPAGPCGPLLLRVRELMFERQLFDPSLAIVETLPESWAPDFTAGWPPGVERSDDLTLIAIHLLRLWARWLPALGTSSVPYLLANLVRRQGEIDIRDRSIDVRLRPGPLDVVLQMAGYLNDIAAVPWLGDRKMSLRIEAP